jgi:phosphoglycolate phosphatase-like HAD superfamily hydrolase
VLRHIRLLILDLDYLVFDCAQLKAQALRQSMISLANMIPQNVPLPGTVEAETGFLEHGSRWIQHLEIGLDEQSLGDLERAYALHESRLIESDAGKIYPGIEEFLLNCLKADISIALGAEAGRDYLIAVLDRYQLDSTIQVALCAEEFGTGGSGEMILDIMRQTEVNPSETLVLGTRLHTFQAAHALDILTIGCAWGIHQHAGLAEADFQARTVADLFAAITNADSLAFQRFD